MAVGAVPVDGADRKMIWRREMPSGFDRCLETTRMALSFNDIVVYVMCMARTNVDIDDEACATVMRRYRLTTKRDAINFALRTLAAEPLGLDEARKLRGTGWVGDLDEMRTHRRS